MNCLSIWHGSKSPICEKWASKQKHSLCAAVIRKTNILGYMVYVAQQNT